MAPALDFQILDELAEDLGDVDFLCDTVAGYLAELPGRRTDMQAAFERNDRAELRARAHSLGSASQMLGAVDLAAQCASIERSALGVDAAGISSMFELWVSSCTRTESAMSEWLLVQGSNR
jgi:HPt (histidine-containing phosphotransfer) domain-containing protein